MAIPTSKPLAMSTVQTEYGGTNPISLSEYYSKGNAPASGEITLWADFNGTSNEATVTSVSQKWNWFGDSTYTTEDTSVTAIMLDNGISYRPSLTPYTLYSYIDSGQPWLGKTILSYSNLSIETKVTRYRDQVGSIFDPPIVIANTSVEYRAEDSSGNLVANLGTDQHTVSGTATFTAVTNADITGAMTDAQIKTWLSQGCPLQHTYNDDFSSDGGREAEVDSPEVFTVRFKADSITYSP